jgi:hypothetical protein
MKAVLLFVLLLSFVWYIDASVPRNGPRRVPNGSRVVASRNHATIRTPDGHREFVIHPTPLDTSVSHNRARDYQAQEGWVASIGTSDNYTYFSAEWIVPSHPVNYTNEKGDYWNTLFYKLGLQDIANTAMVSPLMTYYQYWSGVPSFAVEVWYTPFVGGWYSSLPYYVSPGDRVKGEIALVENTWKTSVYVNGTVRSNLDITFTAGVYIEFPSKPGFVLATTSDNAAQGYLTVKPYDSSKPAGRQFTFTSDGYISLTANRNLVLDVDGGYAKEGARVLVYPKKAAVATNQKWELKGSTIYSKLSGSTFSLALTDDLKVVITKLTRVTLDIGYIAPDEVLVPYVTSTGSAHIALESYDISQCDEYPASDRLDFTNIVLKKGDSQQVVPSWTLGNWQNNCQERIVDISNTAISLRWNSTKRI